MRQPNSINPKIFEIILIVGFILGIASLSLNFFLTLWLFKGSYYLFILEIVLLALNLFCVIFSIILIVMGKKSSSFCICILIIILIIINIICSIGEDIIFYFVYSIFKLVDKIDEVEEDKELEKKYEKFEKIYLKIMKKNFDLEKVLYRLDCEGCGDEGELEDEYVDYEENYEDEDNDKDYKDEDHHQDEDDDWQDEVDDDDDSDKNAEKKIKLLKILPWVSINFNAFIQILSLILIIILLKIIKSQNNYTQFGQTTSLRNQIYNNQNFQVLSNNNNINNQEFQKQKTKIKKKIKEIIYSLEQIRNKLIRQGKKRIKRMEEK